MGRTGHSRYRTNRAVLLSNSDTCHLCGHGGARTADHIITAKDWPRGPDGRHLPGLDDITNLAPAHGTMGNVAINPCPYGCGLCNQRRGDRPMPAATRRPW